MGVIWIQLPLKGNVVCNGGRERREVLRPVGRAMGLIDETTHEIPVRLDEGTAASSDASTVGEERGVVPVNPREEILWVFVDGSDEGGCFCTVPFSIEVLESRKNLNRDVPLTGLDVVEDDRFGQRLPVQIGGHDLQVSNQRSEVTVIGLSEGIHRSVFEFNAFFP